MFPFLAYLMVQVLIHQLLYDRGRLQVVRREMSVTYPTGKSIFRQIFRTIETKRVAAFGQNGLQQKLQANRAAEYLLVEQFAELGQMYFGSLGLTLLEDDFGFGLVPECAGGKRDESLFGFTSRLILFDVFSHLKIIVQREKQKSLISQLRLASTPSAIELDSDTSRNKKYDYFTSCMNANFDGLFEAAELLLFDELPLLYQYC